MKAKQLELPGFTSVQEDCGCKKKSAVTDFWYYVESRNPPHDVIYMDGEGRYYFGERELTRVSPVLFNTLREAKRVARHQKGRAKRFPYHAYMSNNTKEKGNSEK